MLTPLLLLLQSPIAVEVTSATLPALPPAIDATLAIRTSNPERLDFTLEWAGEEARFSLPRAIVRDPGYLLLVDRGDGRLETAEPTAMAYTGLSADGRFRSVVGYDGERLLASLRNLTTGDLVDVETEDVASGVAALRLWPRAVAAKPATMSASVAEELGIVQYAADVDHEGFLLFGGTIADSELRVIQRVAEMNNEHWNDPLENDDPIVENRVTAIVVRSSPADPYASSAWDVLLNKFTLTWNLELNFVVRDAVQLYTGRELDGLTIAGGWPGGLCDSSLEYSLVQQSGSGSFNTAGLHTFMLGVQWGVDPCTGTPGCDLMCEATACGNDNTGFSPAILSQLLLIKDSKACIGESLQGPARATPFIFTVEPSTLTAVKPGVNIVNLFGFGFLGTTSVTVGGVPLDDLSKGSFAVLSDSSLRLRLEELPALGFTAIEVTNALGTGTASLNVVPNTTPAVDLIGGIPQLFSPVDTAQVYVGAGLGDTVYLFASTSQAPSILPGLVSLDLGNNFSQLIQLGVYTVDAATGYVDFTAPLGNLPSGVEFYVQAATISSTAPVLPAPQTNRESGMVVF